MAGTSCPLWRLKPDPRAAQGFKKYAVILAFDVPVAREARELAEEYGVKIFTADIIYHLFDAFTAHMARVRQEEQEAARFQAVFPCILQVSRGGGALGGWRVCSHGPALGSS